MADVFTQKQRSAVMARVRSGGNELTEVALVRHFRRLGISGWRRNLAIRLVADRIPKTIKPDFVFRTEKVAVFVDGEFWHGHPTRGTMPKTNTEFWTRKIEGNKARDLVQTSLLKKEGWTVIRIWQRDINALKWLKKLRAKVGQCAPSPQKLSRDDSE